MHPFLGTTHQLPAIRDRLFEDIGNLIVVVIEDAPQQIRGSLHRGQTFQDNQEGHRDRLDRFHAAARRRRFNQRFGQPGTDITFLPSLHFSPLINAQPRHDGSQIRLGRLNLVAISSRPPQVGIL